MLGCGAYIKSEIHSAAPDDAFKTIGENIDFCEETLHLGMSRAEVFSFLPNPHNTNDENVCVWISDYSNTIQAKEPLSWQWLQSGKGGYFLVFTNGYLATPLCANAAYNPSEALQDYSKLSEVEASNILAQ